MTVVPLANILQPIIDVFEQVLLFFHDTVGAGWGLSIILLTLSVRMLLFPLTRKQFKGMQAMQKLAPEMKKLQEKYKDDKQRINQEMMKLYQEHKVNPFASCLPLVAQLPVFISLFYMLRKDLKEDICGTALSARNIPAGDIVNTSCGEVAKGAGEFLFIPDLTAHPTGLVLVVLIAMYVGSQLMSSLLMSSSIQDPMQRKLMLALPFFFVIFIINFPAGLLVYWITTNLWTVGQQYLLRRSAGMPLPRFPWQEPVEPAVAGGAATIAGAAGITSGKTTRREKAATDEGARTSLEKAPRKGGSAVATNGSAKPKPKAKAPSGNGNGATASGGNGNGNGKPTGTTSPPPSPRKKKKRTGKRR